MLCHKCLAPLLLLSAAIHASAGAGAAAPPPAATRPTTQIIDEWQETSQALRQLLPPPRNLITPADRARVAPAALPLLHKALALSDEMRRSNPGLGSAALQHHYHILAIMAFLGDRPAVTELDDARRSDDPTTAALARHAWYLTRWWPQLTRPAEAFRILDELQTLAAASPNDDDLTSLLLQMREDLPSDSPLRPEIENVIVTHLQGPLAQRATDHIRFAEKRRSLLGKPLLVKAPTIAGQPFSTRSLAGQTILLHFGLTTSSQWQQQHNALLQLAGDLPDKVAIVTILCDESDAVVQAYLSQHKDIPWTVVRDRDNPSGFALQYGIEGFPATIIIAPNGTVSAVDVTPDADLIESLGTPPTTQP